MTETKDTPTPKEIVYSRPGYGRQRYFLPTGTVSELSFDGDTTPEQLDNLVQNALEVDRVALSLGLIPANQTQGASAIAKAGVDKIAEGNGVFHCISMDILPMPGGKAKVALFGNEHKQPRDEWATVTINNWTAGALQAAFEPYYKFKLETFGRALSFDTDFMVEWKNSSKTNTAGNPYKNLVKVHAKVGGAPPKIAQAPAPVEKPPEPEPPLDKPRPFDDIPF